ncbi:hypothetical protein NLG97_g3141 [Lecanicillium saksenae]|uniref:Uncharacterized protein n=1 Tax=Lecanicillium saksenae TaxID=468837 RepID=A0ACC1R0T4_9HYPO|nr:hypothetical protein NLG97_g3141 [Lecanicillium saksenae]
MAVTLTLPLVKEHTNVGESRLLTLPLELRRYIILEVLKHGRRKEPSLSNEVFKDRIQLINRFDEKYPVGTNIYVRGRKTWIHGNAFLQASRQLRQDTLELIEDTRKTGVVEIPFVLDLMVIKDVGLLPTWMSCPYQPEHLTQLTVKVRVFRPDKDLIPRGWVSAIVGDRSVYHYEVTTCQWSFLVVLLFYAMGRLTKSSEDSTNERPLGQPTQSATQSMAQGTDKFSLGPAAPGVDVYLYKTAPYTLWELRIEVE